MTPAPPLFRFNSAVQAPCNRVIGHAPLGAMFHKALLQMRLHFIALVVFTLKPLVQGLDVPSLPGVFFSSVRGVPSNSRNIPLGTYPDVAHNGSGVGSYPLLLSPAALQKSVMNFGECCGPCTHALYLQPAGHQRRAACSKKAVHPPACRKFTSLHAGVAP